MGFRLAEATNAWCIRLNRGDERFRRATLPRVFLLDWVFLVLVEDCAVAGGIREAKSEDRTAPIREIRIRTDDKRWKTTLINFAENWRP
jgi:hypothetical protein